jgi:Zn ribbon nucleic-acid-binding protein
MPAPKDHNCKCPMCQGQAYIYTDESKRYRLQCVTCGYNTYLKTIKHKQNDKKSKSR